MAATGYAERLPQSRTPALFGRVMGLVALTVAVATLGVFLFRNSGGALWFIAWIAALGCLVGLNVANSRGNQSLALGLLLLFGLLIGASVASTVNYYATTDPTAVRQAFGATALFIGGLGAGGYAIRRDLSFLYRFAFWALLALIVAGFVLIFVHIPGAYTAYAIVGARDLRALHRDRLQPPAPGRTGGSDPARGRDLPRHPERVPAVPAAVR